MQITTMTLPANHPATLSRKKTAPIALAPAAQAMSNALSNWRN
jgi:hypothetical protein